MRVSNIVLALGVLLASTACEQGGPKVDLAAEKKAIRALADEWDAATAAKDVAANVAFHAPDGQMLPPGPLLVQGQDGLTKTWEGLFALPGVNLTIDTSKVVVAQGGDLAYEVGTYALAFDGEQGRVEDKGKYVVVWKKVEGTWKAAADIFNSDLPPPK
jgi:uncharacterized protein (TIGR02246 family)